MSKKTPGSRNAIRIGKERYRKERERYREKLRRVREAMNIDVMDVLGEKPKENNDCD